MAVLKEPITFGIYPRTILIVSSWRISLTRSPENAGLSWLPAPDPNLDPVTRCLVTTILAIHQNVSNNLYNDRETTPKPNPRGCDFLATRMGHVLSVVRAHTTFHTYPYLYEVLPQHPSENIQNKRSTLTTRGTLEISHKETLG